MSSFSLACTSSILWAFAYESSILCNYVILFIAREVFSILFSVIYVFCTPSYMNNNLLPDFLTSWSFLLRIKLDLERFAP